MVSRHQVQRQICAGTAPHPLDWQAILDILKLLIYLPFSQGASKTQQMDSVHAKKTGILSLTDLVWNLVIIPANINLQICQKKTSAIKHQELL